MKSKEKRSTQSPIYHDYVHIPYAEILKNLHENDSLIDAIEVKFVKVDDKAAEILMSYSNQKEKTAVQRLTLRNLPSKETEVTVLPFYGREIDISKSLVPVGFMAGLSIALVASLRLMQMNGLATFGALSMMGIFVYLGARYLEENQSPAYYSEVDGNYLLNLLKICLSEGEEKSKQIQALKDSQNKPEDESFASTLRLEDIEAANLDAETLAERKALHRKLDELS